MPSWRRSRPHGETCLTSGRRRRTATPSWWSWCRSWWMIGVRGGGRGGVVVVQGYAEGRERPGRDPPLPPVLQWPPIWTGMSVPGVALAMSLSIQILREVLGCAGGRTCGQEKSTWLALSQRGSTVIQGSGPCRGREGSTADGPRRLQWNRETHGSQGPLGPSTSAALLLTTLPGV